MTVESCEGNLRIIDHFGVRISHPDNVRWDYCRKPVQSPDETK
jgi:hypothetical protein